MPARRGPQLLNPYVGLARRECVDVQSNLGDGGGICVPRCAAPPTRRRLSAAAAGWRPNSNGDLWRESVASGAYGGGAPVRRAGLPPRRGSNSF
jgi:hypothetical protein